MTVVDELWRGRSGRHVELQEELLGRIEELARTLLEPHFESTQDLWKLEIGLLAFQKEQHEAIAELRRDRAELLKLIGVVARNRLPDWKRRLQELQESLRDIDACISTRRHGFRIARRLGDALAQVLFRMQERHFLPLTENKHVPPPPSGHGLQGVLAIAEVFSQAGAGFPVLHDMTDMLRIGDITFVKPGEDPMTVEVKTKLVSKEGDTLQLRVSVFASDHRERWPAISAQTPEAGHQDVEVQGDGTGKEARIDLRLSMTGADLRKQLDRMAQAKTRQTAKPQEIFTIDGVPGFGVELSGSGDDAHWDVVTDLAHRAKVEGYASRVVDDAFLYVALYDDAPFERPQSASPIEKWADRVGIDLIASGIFYPDPEQNALWFGGTEHEVEGKYQPYVFPIFLYGLPIEMIMDLLRRRLAIIVFVNLGRLVAALRASGLDARLPADDAELQQDVIPISVTFEAADGAQLRMTLSGMHRYTQRILDRFLSLDGFVSLMRQVVDAGKNVPSKETGG